MAKTTSSFRNLIAAMSMGQPAATCAAERMADDTGVTHAIGTASTVHLAPVCGATLLRDRHGRRKSLGQGMTEYIVIVALVGVAAIGVYSFLGQSVRGATAGIALEISGQSAQQGIEVSRQASENAVNRARRNTSLGNYHEGNNH